MPLNSWKLGEGVRLDRGIVFTTYATLRQPARGQKMNKDWLRWAAQARLHPKL